MNHLENAYLNKGDNLPPGFREEHPQDHSAMGGMNNKKEWDRLNPTPPYNPCEIFLVISKYFEYPLENKK